MEHFQNDQIIYIILSTEIIMCKNSSEKKQNFISRIQVVMICLFSIRLRKCGKERKKMHAVYMTSRSQEHVYSRMYLTFTRNVEDKMNKRKRQRSFLNSIFFPPPILSRSREFVARSCILYATRSRHVRQTVIRFVLQILPYYTQCTIKWTSQYRLFQRCSQLTIFEEIRCI